MCFALMCAYGCAFNSPPSSNSARGGVTAQVVKTRITLRLATADRLREARTEPLHPVGQLTCGGEVLQDVALLLLQRRYHRQHAFDKA